MDVHLSGKKGWRLRFNGAPHLEMGKGKDAVSHTTAPFFLSFCYIRDERGASIGPQAAAAVASVRIQGASLEARD